MAYSRDLLRGSIDLVVLSTLVRAEKYGYQILTDLRERSAGRIELKAGTLYPILHKLEEEGVIRSRWDESGGRDRKWYFLTDRGRTRLKAEAAEWFDFVGCLRGLLQPAIGGGPANA